MHLAKPHRSALVWAAWTDPKQVAQWWGPNGFSTTILSWSQYSFLSNAAVVVQEQLKDIGISADINLEENAAYIKDYLDNNFDLTVTGTSAYVDPNDIYFNNFGTGQPSNAVRYSNPKADDLIAQGVGTTDQAKRKQIYQQLPHHRKL